MNKKQWKERNSQIMKLIELGNQLEKLTGEELEKKKIQFSNLYKSLYSESWGKRND